MCFVAKTVYYEGESHFIQKNVTGVKHHYENGGSGDRMDTLWQVKTGRELHSYPVFRLLCYNKRSRGYEKRIHL